MKQIENEEIYRLIKEDKCPAFIVRTQEVSFLGPKLYAEDILCIHKYQLKTGSNSFPLNEYTFKSQFGMFSKFMREKHPEYVEYKILDNFRKGRYGISLFIKARLKYRIYFNNLYSRGIYLFIDSAHFFLSDAMGEGFPSFLKGFVVL